MSKAEKSASGLPPLSDAELQEAEDNLVRCLEAYDQRGEDGLQEELELLHPNPALKAAGLRGIWTPLGHAVVSDKSYLKTVKATPSQAEDDGHPIDLNPVILNEKGQSVGPDYLTKEPSSNPR